MEVALQYKSLLIPYITGPPIFGGDSLCPRLGDENGFLLTTLLKATSCGVVGDLGIGFERIEVGEFYINKAFCQINSQLLEKMIKIRVVKLTICSP